MTMFKCLAHLNHNFMLRIVICCNKSYQQVPQVTYINVRWCRVESSKKPVQILLQLWASQDSKYNSITNLRIHNYKHNSTWESYCRNPSIIVTIRKKCAEFFVVHLWRGCLTTIYYCKYLSPHLRFQLSYAKLRLLIFLFLPMALGIKLKNHKFKDILCISLSW